ncbi:hypothetical protein PN416_11550 [Halorubrum ezzemoulense]|uniref:hypothetical protein n=1 Tax=Halorubrum ezzemoulense TaxID=337243 RepID=UPI00232B0D4C|nr:hypothetical protein [Halorubrum ezzemoulense]MDB9280749.1 hypothetical protein [Halorubrum ezzemoulense]MDB9284072.1 hypothetical protein [Halorubrum ezzemoulense]
MQTGTTPPRRAATEPPSDRSTSGTGARPRTSDPDSTGRDEAGRGAAPEVAP